MSAVKYKINRFKYHIFLCFACQFFVFCLSNNTYAKQEDFKFSNKTAKLAGDLNGDGSINTSDVALMNRLLLEVSAPPASENADMNNDKVFNVFDVALAKKKSLGK